MRITDPFKDYIRRSQSRQNKKTKWVLTLVLGILSVISLCVLVWKVETGIFQLLEFSAEDILIIKITSCIVIVGFILSTLNFITSYVERCIEILGNDNTFEANKLNEKIEHIGAKQTANTKRIMQKINDINPSSEHTVVLAIKDLETATETILGRLGKPLEEVINMITPIDYVPGASMLYAECIQKIRDKVESIATNNHKVKVVEIAPLDLAKKRLAVLKKTAKSGNYNLFVLKEQVNTILDLIILKYKDGTADCLYRMVCTDNDERYYLTSDLDKMEDMEKSIMNKYSLGTAEYTEDKHGNPVFVLVG